MTLFGVRYLTPATIFPQYLDHFIDILPPNYKISMNELLNKHTLLPFYAPFISSDRVEKIIQCMRSGQGNPFAFTGIANSKIQIERSDGTFIALTKGVDYSIK